MEPRGNANSIEDLALNMIDPGISLPKTIRAATAVPNVNVVNCQHYLAVFLHQSEVRIGAVLVAFEPMV